MTVAHSEDRHNITRYALVTASYWGFTLTDGALRMLVLLHFHTLGYTPLQLASLFLLYEICGVVTNITGGWVGSRIGLHKILISGLALQILAILALSFLDPTWPKALAVPFVIAVQGLSGIAKDLTKMSAKSSLKLILPGTQNATLFKWVALLTGSKNSLKGVGFFLGGLLLGLAGFAPALWIMAALLAAILAPALYFLSGTLGIARAKVTFVELFSKNGAINLLAAARLFLFGARDVWFVVALPLFLYETLGLSFSETGGLMALWIIGYGLVQSITPLLIRSSPDGLSREIRENRIWIFLLSLLPFAIVAAMQAGLPVGPAVLGGLALFGLLFAVNSALHSYLILAFATHDRVAVDVGFYYSANAGGRLLGTLLSGLFYQFGGLEACLLGSGAMLLLSLLCSVFIAPGAKLKTID